MDKSSCNHQVSWYDWNNRKSNRKIRGSEASSRSVFLSWETENRKLQGQKRIRGGEEKRKEVKRREEKGKEKGTYEEAEWYGPEDKEEWRGGRDAITGALN